MNSGVSYKVKWPIVDEKVGICVEIGFPMDQNLDELTISLLPRELSGDGKVCLAGY
jgi:hypothetical protein